MLKLKNIVIKRSNRVVLNNVMLTADVGELITIIGANGAGKSTLFDAISGSLKISSGVVEIDGKNITNQDELERTSMLGRLFQDPSLSCVPSLTVRENLAIAMYKGKKVSLRNGLSNFSYDLLQGFDSSIEELLDKKMKDLSGGQRQFVSLLMATAIKPKLLLLDEPTAALDPKAATKLLAFIASYVRTHKITTLLITHDPNIALALGDNIWIVQNNTVQELVEHDLSSCNLANIIAHIDYDALKQIRKA